MIFESTLMVSLREPALMTSSLTLDVLNVALTPSTVATMDAPLLASATVMSLACPVVPVQVSTPDANVGVTLSMTRCSRGSSPLNGTADISALRRR
jgi:hypothetical protein